MKRLVNTLIICVAVATAWAVPARRGGIVVTQADGTEINVFQHGDEYFHWTTNSQGEWIERGEDGMYKVVPALSETEIRTRIAKSPRRIANQVKTASPLNIAPRGLVILVNFSDKAFATSKAEMDSMLNGQNYTRSYSYTYNGEKYNISAQGSARQYFNESSFGQYTPQFDVVGPVTVSQKMAYYGGDNDAYAYKMVVEACKKADQQFNVDFSQYDNDNDGDVDFVYFFYAGYGEADSHIANTIWPHSYEMDEYAKYYDDASIDLDGKHINKYACSNEINYLSKKYDGIGTFCHEFSHVLGLPDMYITQANSNHRTLDTWDIMDYGPYNNDGNTPPAYSGYERFFMGWIQPRILTQPELVTLPEVNSSKEVLLISATDKHNLIGNDPSPITFYLLENRQQTGWDKYLEGHGLMLTKINYSYQKWYNNIVNDYSSSMGIDLIEADGLAPEYDENDSENGYFAKPGDLFPTGATSYTKISGHPINDIKETNGVITFNYKNYVPSSVQEIQDDQKLIGIYTLTGQQMPEGSELPHGAYIIRTTNGSHKIIR
ncbi:MAG: M6 family metalloprotease domain-containing protein [Paludibacteraceae bacterium]